MEILKGIELRESWKPQHKKVCDLINYEGPILSYFVDTNGNHLLYYWVDQDEHSNRWLIAEIAKQDLYLYLNGNKSLKDLISLPIHEFLYSIDIDTSFRFLNQKMLFLNEVPEAYIPDESSFFTFPIPAECASFIEHYKSENLQNEEYLNLLKSNAIYLKLESTEQKFGKTVSTSDAASFLSNLANSFNNFAEISLMLQGIAKNQTQNLKKKIKETFTPRIVNLAYSSFEVAISIDPVTYDNELISGKNKTDILLEYKDEVMYADWVNPDFIARVKKKYNNEERVKIYEPFFEILKNERTSLYLTDAKHTFKKKIPKITTNQKVQILNPKEIIREVPQYREVLAKIKVVEGRNYDQKHLKAEVLSLFDEEPKCLAHSLNKLESQTFSYDLNFPLYVFREDIDNVVYLENQEYGLFAQGDTYVEALEMFKQEFDFIYNRYNELSDNELTVDVQIIKQYLNRIVKK